MSQPIPHTTLCYIGLGSNLEQPLQQVEAAVAQIAALPEVDFIAHSPWYGSTAIGPGEQPDYVNGVAQIRTRLGPETLLQALQTIELEHGRERRVRWAARTLDLDLLLYGEEVIDTDALQVPHPRLMERNFVLYPLADLCPDLILPNGASLQSLLARVSAAGLWKLSGPELGR